MTEELKEIYKENKIPMPEGKEPEDHCDKHGFFYLIKNGCPECKGDKAKEKEKSDQIKALQNQVETLQEELEAIRRDFETRDRGMGDLELHNQRLKDNLSIVMKEKEALILENKNLRKIVKMVKVAVG